MTLKQNQGHQTYSDIVDPEQGYNYAKFESPRFNSVREKGNIEGCFSFFSSKEICTIIISLEQVQKKLKNLNRGISMIYLM